MKKINYGNDNIKIITEKKKLFGGISQKEKEIFLKDVSQVRRETFEGKLNSLLICTNDNNEEFITADEMGNEQELDKLFEFFVEKRNENAYKLKELEISTLEEKDI